MKYKRRLLNEKNKVKIVTALINQHCMHDFGICKENLIKMIALKLNYSEQNGWRFSGRDGWVMKNENSADCTTDEVHSGEKALHFNSAVVAQSLN